MSVQTVYWLHTGSRVVHLDITSSNVMLRPPEECRDWDDLLLLDFGFAQTCSKGMHGLGVSAHDATISRMQLVSSASAMQTLYEGCI